MSATSQSITLHTPLRIHRIDDRHYAIAGTPAAAVILAADALQATGPASGLFLGRSLPAARVLDLDAESVEAEDRA